MKLRLSLLVLAMSVGVFAVFSTRPTMGEEPESKAKEPSLEAEIKTLQEIRAKELEQIQKIKNLLAKEKEKLNKEVATTEKRLQEMKTAYAQIASQLSSLGISVDGNNLGVQGIMNGGIINWPVGPYNGPASPYGQSIPPYQNPGSPEPLKAIPEPTLPKPIPDKKDQP
jgi:hypothetical protein